MIKKIFRFIKNILTRVIRPVYYSYTGFRVYNLIKRVGGYKEEKRLFLKKLGYSPDLKNPRSLNEKVLWRKLYDRNPLLPVVSDKYLVREYLKGVLGESDSEKILVSLFYVTSDPETIPFNDLEEEYVIKSNHACKEIIFAENIDNQKRYTLVNHRRTAIIFDCAGTREEIIKVCKEWISRPHGFHRLAWKNQPIKRKIIVEKLLRDERGKIPEDFKFHIFHGKCQLIQVIYDRFTDKNIGFYTPEWKYMDLTGKGKKAGYKKRPDNLGSMIVLAESLGRPFDYIRIDLYSIKDHIYFGEFTSYPADGRNPLKPVSYDFELGSKWRLIPKYWLPK